MSMTIPIKAQCVSLLQDCIALQLKRVGPTTSGVISSGGSDAHYWMYDSGYLLFQGFLEANLKCFWDGSLVTAVKGLEFMGYICPGVLLVTGSPACLHLVRSAWSRAVLKPPPNYQITLLGDVEDCTVSKVRQAGFTPLSDAVCWAILELGASGQSAVLDTVRKAIAGSFPKMEQPSTHQLYDTLADLMSENKVYQTSQGYFVATPDSVRLEEAAVNGGRSMLMTHSEATALVHGEIVTIRQGPRTHQSIQTNLADVICGGNKNDKILYPRMTNKGTPRKLERRHSMRLLGSSRKLSSLHRAGSVRLLYNGGSEINKKSSLLSKLFRWSRRQSPLNGALPAPNGENYPPHEWFNSSVLHYRSIAIQTETVAHEETTDWSSECGTLRSTRRRSLSTSRLPRRRSRAPSVSPSRQSTPSTPTPASSKTLLCPTNPMSSASSGYNSLPRSHKSKVKTGTMTSTSTNASSTTPKSSVKHQAPSSKNSIKVEVSSNPSRGLVADTKVDTRMTTSTTDSSAMLTTTINGPNSTKIYVQQQNSPMRSVITFEKARKTESPSLVPTEVIVPEEHKERKGKSEKRLRRPASLYHQKDTSQKEPKRKTSVQQVENDRIIKFPSTETIHLEEKPITADKNNKNLRKWKNDTDISEFKTGSLVDLANSYMNNMKKTPSSGPLQPSLSNDKVVLESLSYKNIFKESHRENKLSALKLVESKNNSNKLVGKDTSPRSFPSLSDLSVHFTSIAAQNILKGVSVNSIDTLVEVNMAADKHPSIKDSIHTDLGVV